MAYDDLLVQTGRLERGTASYAAVTGVEVIAWALEQEAVAVYVRPGRVPADLRPGELQTVTHIIHARPIQALKNAPRGHWRFIVDGHEYRLVDPEDAAQRGHHMEIRARRLS